MESLLPLILQLIAGAAGGNVGGAAVKNATLGTLGNTISGAIGGVISGQVIAGWLGMAAEAGGFDIGNIATSAVGGLVLQVIAGLVKAQMNKSA